MKVKGTYAQRVFARLIQNRVISASGGAPEIVDMVTGRLVAGQSYKRIAKQAKAYAKQIGAQAWNY